MEDKAATQREDKIRAAERVLGSPVILECSDELSKTRLRLLVTAAFAIAIGYFNLRIEGDASFVGAKVQGLSNEVVRTVLVVVLSYLLIHFVWGMWDGLREWSLRLTGFNETFVSTQISTKKEVDTPRSARQLTLYSWWMRQAINIGHLDIALKQARTSIDQLDAATLVLPRATDRQDISSLKPTIDEIHKTLNRLEHEANKATTIVDSDHVRAALRRFDRRFMLFQISQNLRWLVFDLLAPALVGLTAIIAVTWPWWSALLSTIRQSTGG